MDIHTDAIGDRDLVLQFESLGDNCEFGLVQRKAGAEPLGLLRFSSAPLPRLVRALRERFDGLTDPANVRLSSAKGEYPITTGSGANVDGSLSEPDFVWALDDRSLIVLAPPAGASNYRFDIEMTPFVQPEIHPPEYLEVMVNGVSVHTFYPVRPGLLSSVVPGRLIPGRDKVEVLLIHPRASRPGELDGDADLRRPARMFRRVALVALSK